MRIRSSRLIYSGIVLLFLLLIVGISSADDVNVEFVSHFGGEVFDVAVAFLIMSMLTIRVVAPKTSEGEI